MGQDSYIKIEWAKDYFGPDVVMAKQNDNVAQLCYYFRHLKEIIAWAKELNVGDTRVPDDEYVLLYEDEIAKECCAGQNLRLVCMEYAARAMSVRKYLNAFQYSQYGNDDGYWHVEKSWPRNFGYYCKPACDYQVFCDLPLTFPDFEQYKEALYRYNSYKNTNGISLSNFYFGSKFLSETPAYEFVPKFVLDAEAQFFREKSYNALDEQCKWEEKHPPANHNSSGLEWLLFIQLILLILLSLVAVIAKLVNADFENIGWCIFCAIISLLILKTVYKDLFLPSDSASNRIDEIIFKSNNKPVDNRDWKDKL